MAERALPRAGQQKVRNERFRGLTDVFTLSDVYFNERRTLALTVVSSWCGDLCALYQWKVFEKLDTGKWEERQWVGCVTVAGSSDLRRSIVSLARSR